MKYRRFSKIMQGFGVFFFLGGAFLQAEPTSQPNALRISLDAAMRSGRMLTAETRVKALLAGAGVADAEGLYLGATVARLNGNDGLARTRYLAFSNSCKKGDPRLRKAARYLLEKGSYPDLYKRYIKSRGVSDDTWRLGVLQMEKIATIPDPTGLLEFAGFIMKTFKHPSRVSYIHSRLWQAAEAFQLGRKDEDRYLKPLTRMLSCPPPDNPTALVSYFFSSRVVSKELASPSEVVEMIFQMQSLFEKPCNSRFPLSTLSKMNQIQSAEQRASAGAKFLALESIYKSSPNPRDYKAWMDVFLKCPAVFNALESPLVSTVEMEKKFSALAQRFSSRPGVLSEMTRKIGSQYFGKTEPEREVFFQFLKAHLSQVHPLDFISMVKANEGAGFDPLLAGALKGRSFGEALEYQWRVLSAYNAAGKSAEAFSIAKDYLRVNPGAFDANQLIGILTNQEVEFADREALLRDTARDVGESELLLKVIKTLSTKRYSAEWGMSEVLTAAEKAVASGKVGKDKLAWAHACLSAKKVDAKKYKAVMKALSQRVSAHKGVVPCGLRDAGDLKQTRMAMLWTANLSAISRNSALRNRVYVSGLLDVWLAKLGPGDGWGGLITLVSQTDRSSLHQVGKRFDSVMGDRPDWQFAWQTLAGVTHPSGDPWTIPSKHFRDIDPDRVIDYIKRNAAKCPPNALLAQIADFTKPNVSALSFRLSRFQAILPLLSKAATKKTPVSTELETSLRAVQKATESLGIFLPETAAELCNLSIRSGRSTQAETYRKEYLASLSRKTIGEKIRAHDAFRSTRPLEQENQPLVSGGRLGSLLTTLKPLYAKAMDDSTDVTIRAAVISDLQAVISKRSNGKDKASAESMLSMLASLILNGASIDSVHYYTGLFATMDTVCADAIAKKQWLTVVDDLIHYAGLLGSGSKPNWDANMKEHVLPLVDMLEKEEAHEVAYLFVQRILKEETLDPRAEKHLAMIRGKLGRHLPSLVSVSRSDPAYELHVAGMELSSGNQERAWELTRPNIDRVAKHWQELDPDYVQWCLSQMRKQKLLEEGLNLARYVLLQESELPAELAARVSLVKGDIYAADQNYQAARSVYEALLHNDRYRETPSGLQARFKLVDLFLLTHDFSSAESSLERLVDSDDISTQAEAYYLQAKMSFLREDFEGARELIKQVTRRVINHAEAPLLTAEINLKLKNFANPEVDYGDPKLSSVLDPTRTLTLKILDLNLLIARGNSSIPIVVRTSRGGDEERIDLVPDSSNKALFKGTIATALGLAKKHNVVLEVRGDDEVSYVIAEDFQKANNINYPPKQLYIRSDARLVASAGELLSEQEALRREQEQRATPGRKHPNRSDRSVRPGSELYVQVRDFDRDISEGLDTVTVDLKTSSGDHLSGFELTETGEHTGVFKGAVPTDLPLPRASASDCATECDPSALINASKEGGWESLADGMKPKWVEVDLMNSVNVKSVRVDLPDPDSIRHATLFGMLAEDMEELGVFPSETTEEGHDGLSVEIAEVSSRSEGGKTADSMRKYLDIARTQRYRQESATLNPLTGRSVDSGKKFVAQMKGQFYTPVSRLVEFKFPEQAKKVRGAYQHLFIDGKRVLSSEKSRGDKSDRRVHLAKGAHRFVLLVSGVAKTGSTASVLYLNEQGQFEKVPSEWFSVKAFPDLAAYIKPKAEILRVDGALVATLSDPRRLRRLRWVFEDFSGNTLRVSKCEVTDASGKKVVPTQNDFTSGLNNRILEISPGDNIYITYRDEKNLREEASLLSETLNSSFYNGSIEADWEMMTMSEEGRRTSKLFPAKRCRAGDSLLILVEDYDVDVSDERDTLDVFVSTSGGEKIMLKALETSPSARDNTTATADDAHAHAGVFMTIVRFGDTTMNDTIKIGDGEEVTVSYFDRENTDPGIPFSRSYTLIEAGRDQPEILVYRTSVSLVEDTSPTARAKAKRIAGKASDETVIMKSQIVARHPKFQQKDRATPSAKTISVTPLAPVLFEVRYPQMALHAGSRFAITAVAESEKIAAEKEGREPSVLTIPMSVEGITALADDKGYPVQLQSDDPKNAEMMLNAGTFAGVIRLQIGAIGDVIDNIVSEETRSFDTSESTDEDSEKYIVPTLLVSGSDTIYLALTEEETGTVLVSKNLHLSSDAQMELLDRSYSLQTDAIYLGDRFYIRLTDPDRDTTDQQDSATVNATSKSGGRLSIKLSETLTHSGVFTGSVKPVFHGRKTTSSADGMNQEIEVNFGDVVTFAYTDSDRLTETSPESVVSIAKIYYGTDADVTLFTKRFDDAEMAVKIRLLRAEALFEKAKQDRVMDKVDEANATIEQAERILTEATRDYPNTELQTHGDFLLANLAQELGKYDEALGKYSQVISKWPDSEYAPRCQLKKAICYEKMEHEDQACEEYVKLTYVYPESDLVPKATTRLAQHYYRKERYDVAGKIFQSFQASNPDHSMAPKCLFLSAQCRIKEENHGEAAALFGLLCETYKEDKDLRAEAMYWQAESHFKHGSPSKDGERRQGGGQLALEKAYQTFKMLTWDYPESKWAKYARGRLTDESLIKIEEDIESR